MSKKFCFRQFRRQIRKLISAWCPTGHGCEIPHYQVFQGRIWKKTAGTLFNDIFSGGHLVDYLRMLLRNQVFLKNLFLYIFPILPRDKVILYWSHMLFVTNMFLDQPIPGLRSLNSTSLLIKFFLIYKNWYYIRLSGFQIITFVMLRKTELKKNEEDGENEGFRVVQQGGRRRRKKWPEGRTGYETPNEMIYHR